MTNEGPSRIERFLEQTARRVSGGSLHPLEILQRVRAAFEASANDGTVANHILITFHPGDFARYQPSLPQLRNEIESLLDDEQERGRWRTIGERRVAFASSETAAEGRPAVTATFADTSLRPQASPPGATRRLVRQRSLALVLSDGTRVPVTHTPFSIGRGPGNDLVLPSLAVSRNHAELVATETGYALHDLGSRNGLMVEGERCEVADMDEGPVHIGDVALWLERQA